MNELELVSFLVGRSSISTKILLIVLSEQSMLRVCQLSLHPALQSVSSLAPSTRGTKSVPQEGLRAGCSAEAVGTAPRR